MTNPLASASEYLERSRALEVRYRNGDVHVNVRFSELVQNVRGEGIMLAFDLARPDWRDSLRERAFRLGLIVLPAGERTLRFYPRYDMEPYAIREAVALLERALCSLIEEAVLSTGPAWIRSATVLHKVENYLGSGIRFVYLQAPLGVC